MTQSEIPPDKKPLPPKPGLPETDLHAVSEGRETASPSTPFGPAFAQEEEEYFAFEI